jgi:acyl-CoA thioesterase-2
MSSAVADLLSTLDLEPLERNLFRGTGPDIGTRVFGGQVIAQALMAAMRTVEDRPVHSLHCYFLLGGDPSIPIIYEVDRIRDGKSFTTRRVVAIQHGAAIFSMSASFHVAESGWEHQAAMPDVPPPEELASEAELAERLGDKLPESVRRFLGRGRPIELRPTDPARFLGAAAGQSVQNLWIRAAAPLPADEAVHRCVLAYASDMTLLDTSLVPHGKSVFLPDVMAASLDHALWFHRPVQADQWLLYAQDSPFSGAGRGLSRGLIFSRDGALVASVAQEGLIRPRRPR